MRPECSGTAEITLTVGSMAGRLPPLKALRTSTLVSPGGQKMKACVDKGSLRNWK